MAILAYIYFIAKYVDNISNKRHSNRGMKGIYADRNTNAYENNQAYT